MEFQKIEESELEGIKSFLNLYIKDELEDMDESEELEFPIMLISGVKVQSDLIKEQDWFKELEFKEHIFPEFLIIMRTLDLSNTGYNWIIFKENNEYKVFEENEQFGNAPAFQGCIDEDEDENYLLDDEGKEWINELYNDIENNENIWI